MQEIIDLSKAGHALTSQIKQLHLESQSDHSGIYKVYTKWPGHPNLDDYLRIGYDDENHINYIDFDGGPWLTIGSKVGNYTITDFTHNGNFEDVKVIVQDDVCN